MGKSPAKWIKTVLFGKKSSKSPLSKDATSAKKVPASDLVQDRPVRSDPASYIINGGEEKTELDNVTTTGLSGDTLALSSVAQNVDSLSLGAVSVDDAEMKRQEKAATKAQAVFRGYLARRAFRALKGIIRLQALIRGHLVRRQAVATLRCMQAIVRSQALVRGRRVRLSNPVCQGIGNYSLRERKDAKLAGLSVTSMPLRPDKLAANAFVCKLLAIVPKAMPLSLQYDVTEPNSAWNWLERWSLSRFWEPLPRPKKIQNPKSQRKHGVHGNVEMESGRPKRSVRKAPISSNAENHGSSSFDFEKPKRVPRKTINHQTETSSLEQPQAELERVKRNLRKVSASSTTVPPEKPDVEIEKVVLPAPLELPKSLSDPYEVREQAIPEDSLELITEAKIESVELAVSEPSPEPDTVDNITPAEQLLSENVESGETPHVKEEYTSKEDQTGKENQRSRRRRSLPVKQEPAENVSQNAPSLPSYMAATESAKAKLKAQGATRPTNEDDAENGFIRRHSLPSLTNGKLNALSPRLQRPVQPHGKGGNKTNKSVSATRDEKGLHPGWRR
ncbi:unnamed protein product [Cuscuta epithymum]|uniref:DUF4005 domain-containing protein n=1 Tax=Cuscuta epithymum TaxID=186058 RepID=A0AAV0E9X0_9ASTE|nr:unnamed protein product [Cuscuta epithymum]